MNPELIQRIIESAICQIIVVSIGLLAIKIVLVLSANRERKRYKAIQKKYLKRFDAMHQDFGSFQKRMAELEKADAEQR
jgi:hypothetical protein